MLLASQSKRSVWLGGVLIGPIAWITSYVVLPFTKIYKPIWDYDAKTLWEDLSAHVVYGLTIGTVAAIAARSVRDLTACGVDGAGS